MTRLGSMMRRTAATLLLPAAIGLGGLAAATVYAQASGDDEATSSIPAPPTGLVVRDRGLDGGDALAVQWTASTDDVEPPEDDSNDADDAADADAAADGTATDGAGDASGDATDDTAAADPAEQRRVVGYRIERTLTPDEVADQDAKRVAAAEAAARTAATEAILGADWDGDITGIDAETLVRIRTARAEAGEAARAAEQAIVDALPDEERWTTVTTELTDEWARSKPGGYRFAMTELVREPYRVRVAAISLDGSVSEWTTSAEPVTPSLQFFDGGRIWVFVFMVLVGGSIVFFIYVARSGRELKVRRIAGLEAVDEAVGRATEMGRSVMFVPGIQDMNEIQTIAGITILARVAKVAAEYDAKVEVPTARSLVMTTARETVEAAYLAAGRPDAYNEDLIYYVTNEQFGYVAYLSGMMVREKPAACIYMGMFYAESLILAETGNMIGAIQVAGTAQPAQLPFFVAACDYTLIGEEFFAASAYLSGSREELGSLKGQDFGKIIAALLILAGVLAATLSSVLGSGPDDAGAMFTMLLDYMRTEMLK